MPDLPSVAVVCSGAALAVSIITMWVTLFRKGALKMTQPTTVMFGPDGEFHDGPSKLYLRFLLYSSAKRGLVVENMFCRLSRGEHRQNFPIWVLGDDRLARGSGIFVGEQGVVANHHFLLPPDADKYVFKSGEYRLEVYARTVGAAESKLLWVKNFLITHENATDLGELNSAIYFDWGPDSNRYLSVVKSKRPPMPAELLKYFERGLPTTSPTAEGSK